jgi:diguanylate cyclase
VDIPCRYGGDEFAALLPNAEKGEALVVAGRIRERASRKLGGLALRIGIAELDGNISSDEFIVEAEKAMKLQTIFREKRAEKIVTINTARQEKS